MQANASWKEKIKRDEGNLDLSILLNDNIWNAEELEKLRQNEKSLPKHLNYRSPEIQNELIGIIASALREVIVKDIYAAPFLTPMVDGTKNRRGEEILSTAARYLKNDRPQESLISLEKCTALDAKSVTKIVMDSLKQHGWM